MVAHNPFSDLSGLERDIIVAIGRNGGEVHVDNIRSTVTSAASNGVAEHDFHPCLGNLVDKGMIQKTSGSPAAYKLTRAGMRGWDEYQTWVVG